MNIITTNNKLSMEFIKAYQRENRLIAFAASKIGKTLDSSALGILPELSENFGIELVSGPSQDMDFPGLKYKASTSLNSPKSQTVAFKIYNDLYRNKKLPDEDMEIVWKTYSGKEKNNGPYNCAKICKNPILKISKLILHEQLNILLANVFPCLMEGYRQQCPPIPTIDAYYLLNNSTITKDDVENIIKDKFVFYGGDLDAVNNLVYPPTHHNIPGVYFNAMALDNLLSNGDNYKLHPSNDGEGNKKTKSKIYWLEFFGLVVIVFFIEFNALRINYAAKLDDEKIKKKLKPLLKQFWRAFNKWFYFFVTYLSSSLLFLGLLVCSSFYRLHIPPIDFLALGCLVCAGLRWTPLLSQSFGNLKNLSYKKTKKLINKTSKQFRRMIKLV